MKPWARSKPSLRVIECVSAKQLSPPAGVAAEAKTGEGHGAVQELHDGREQVSRAMRFAASRASRAVCQTR